MARFLKNRSKLIGKAPGTIIFIGNKKLEQARFSLISYDTDSFEQIEEKELDFLLDRMKKPGIHWLNVDGIHDLESIQRIGSFLGLSLLQIEGIANSDQRPKVLEENNLLMVTVKMLKFNPTTRKVMSDQLTVILGNNAVITFQENVGTVFNPIRERLSSASGKLRSSGPDYLLYRILDAVADNYLLCLGELGEIIEKNEEMILSRNHRVMVGKIYYHKLELSYIRKAIWPVKEVMAQLRRSDSGLIHSNTLTYLNSLDNIVIHAIETVDIYYSMINDQLNIYNTNTMNHTNDVMKVLTIFASIFIPLTFIVGVYGTNFDYLPELHMKYGYFVMWAIMILLAAIMLYYFRRRKWL